FRLRKSRENSTGTAASSPTRRCNGCCRATIATACWRRGRRQDTLVFQLDLWSARGELPRNLIEVELRQKDIRFSSRTRSATDQFKKMQMARRTAAKLLKKLPKDLQQSPEAERLAELADE